MSGSAPKPGRYGRLMGAAMWSPLDGRDLCVLLALITLSNEEDEVRAGYAEIAHLARVSKDSVKRSMKILTSLELINEGKQTKRGGPFVRLLNAEAIRALRRADEPDGYRETVKRQAARSKRVDASGTQVPEASRGREHPEAKGAQVGAEGTQVGAKGAQVGAEGTQREGLGHPSEEAQSQAPVHASRARSSSCSCSSSSSCSCPSSSPAPHAKGAGAVERTTRKRNPSVAAWTEDEIAIQDLWVEWLVSPGRKAAASALDTPSALERRKYIRRALKATGTDRRTGEAFQANPPHRIKMGILGGAVNVARCKARGDKAFPKLVTIIRTLDDRIEDLEHPSSIFPTEVDLEELAKSEEGFAQICKHAEELIQRAKEGNPYQASNGRSRQTHNAPRYVYNEDGVGYNPNNPRDFDYSKTQAEGFIDRVCRGDQELYGDQTEAELQLYRRYINREKLNHLYESRRTLREQHQAQKIKEKIAQSIAEGGFMSREGKLIGCFLHGWTVRSEDQELYEQLKGKVLKAWADAGIQP